MQQEATQFVGCCTPCKGPKFNGDRTLILLRLWCHFHQPVHGQRSWTALAYHGNGVAMGSWCGRTVARMMMKEDVRKDVLAFITRRLAKFPLPLFRPLYLKGACLWFGLKDSR